MKKLSFSLLILCLIIGTVHAQSGTDQLIEDALTTWDKHVAMNALLLEGIKEDYLSDKSASGGRNVGEQFGHLYDVRLMWLSQLAADKVNGMDEEIDADESLKKEYLTEIMTASDKVVRAVLKEALQKGTRFGEMSATRFLGYLISHESHTRGQIILAMKQSGHPLPPQVTYGIWEW